MAMPSTDGIRDAVALACRAPSLYNTQPWHWVFDGHRLHLFSDPGRMLAGTDPFGREMVISCGVVLDHLVVALAGRRWRAKVHRFPDPDRRELLASISFAPVMLVTHAEHDRTAAISRRRTDRAPFGAVAEWAHHEAVLRSIAEDYAVEMTVLPASAHPGLLHAARVAGALRGQDGRYLAELRWWRGPSDGSTEPPAPVTVDASVRPAVWAGRDAAPPDTGWTDADLSDDLATVVVLSTGGDGPLDCLRCGEALSAVLLECTAAGLATCPLTHLTELPASRAVVAELIGRKSVPQVLVRIGARTSGAPTGPPTPRRPLAEVFEASPSD